MNNVFNYKKPIVMKSSISISKKTATLDSVFRQVYRTDYCIKWLSMKPIVEMRCKEEVQDVGSISTLYFRCPYFYYYVKIEQVEHGQYIKGTLFGAVSGFLSIELHEDDDYITLTYTLSIQGKNKFIHWYYVLTCFLPHEPYMWWRLKVLMNRAKKAG